MANVNDLRPKIVSVRQKIAFYLDDFNSTLGIIINSFILGLIFLSSLIFVAETYTVLQPWLELLRQLDIIILIIFSLEYLTRVWCAEAKLKFIFSPLAIVDLISILPLLVGLVDVRFIRIFRWFRLLRVIRFIDLEVSIFRIRNEDGVILTRIILILFTIIFVYSGLIYQVEHQTNPETFDNFFDAFYFSVVTMTTVGFGDITPLSDSGKIITLLMIFTGIMIIPWQLGELIKQLMKTANHSRKKCSGCGLSFHDTDANFCKICGTELTPNSQANKSNSLEQKV